MNGKKFGRRRTIPLDTQNIADNINVAPEKNQVNTIHKINKEIDQLLLKSDYSRNELDRVIKDRDNEENKLNTLQKEIKLISKGISKIESRMLPDINKSELVLLKKTVYEYQGNMKTANKKYNDTSINIDKIQSRIDRLLLAVRHQSKFLENFPDQMGGFQEKLEYIKVLDTIKRLKKNSLVKVAQILTMDPNKFNTKSHLLSAIELLYHAKYFPIELSDLIIVGANIGIDYSNFFKNKLPIKESNELFIKYVNNTIKKIPFNQIAKRFMASR
jgi:hypothetical protein